MRTKDWHVTISCDVVQLFKMEDVSVGLWVGQFAKDNHVKYEHSMRFAQAGCVPNYLSAHYQSPRQMLCLWDKLLDHDARCCNMWVKAYGKVYLYSSLLQVCITTEWRPIWNQVQIAPGLIKLEWQVSLQSWRFCNVINRILWTKFITALHWKCIL